MPFQLDLEEFDALKAAMTSFPTASGCGRDGFFPQYFRDLLKVCVPEYVNRYLKQFSLVINRCLDGSIPLDLMPYLACAGMTALKKKDSSVPRPIAVGLTFRRLISKLAAKEGRKVAGSNFLGSQFGVGTELGAEGIIHSLRTLIEEGNWDRNVFVALVDFSNAFNRVDRSKLFAAVRKFCPSLSKWVEACYQSGSFIFMSDGHSPFQSTSGVQQGDPLGPFFIPPSCH